MMTFGVIDGGGACMCCGGALFAICALCGIYKCSQLRMRDCSCIKWCMRMSGADEFDDFDLMVIVHEATYSTTTKRKTNVRLSAGCQQVFTNSTTKGNFHEALQVLVEQGTSYLLVELVEGKSVLASLKLGIVETILKGGGVREKEYALNSKARGFCNPRVKLTLTFQKESDAEKGIISDLQLSKGTEILLQQQLLKDKAAGVSSEADAEPKSAIDAIIAVVRGNLEMFCTFGTQSMVFVAVVGPPVLPKYRLCVFKDEKEHAKGGKPQTEINLLKVLGIQEDPVRRDVFLINFMDGRKNRERISFRRIDLPTATWVELLTKLIRLIREERDERAKPPGNNKS